jgi:alpha-ketoglutarate-dependent taurine dioxygenase
VKVLDPFGVEIGRPGAVPELDPGLVRDAVARHRLAVIRDVPPPADRELIAWCARLGEIAEFEFGAVNELTAKPDARNYLFTHAEVPFHWDGAFIGRVPSYIVFYCAAAPPEGAGGETTFCDTVRLLAGQPAGRRAEWSEVRITYATEKIVHYGGTFTSPLVREHPHSGEPVLRFAEPVADLNPVTLDIAGARDPEGLITAMRELLRSPLYCYAHRWRNGDLVIADNHALLHGRRAFETGAPRHLRRVNVL